MHNKPIAVLILAMMSLQVFGQESPPQTAPPKPCIAPDVVVYKTGTDGVTHPWQTPDQNKNSMPVWRGQMNMEIVVNNEGRVCSVKVLSADDQTAAKKLADYILEHWTYQPATREGQPVAASYIQQFGSIIGRVQEKPKPPFVCQPSPTIQAKTPHERGVHKLSGEWYMNRTHSIWAMRSQPWTQGEQKVPWIRPAGADLKLGGWRLDGPSPPLRVSVVNSPTSFQLVSMEFPTAGCWEVVGRTANEEPIVFITQVEPSSGH